MRFRGYDPLAKGRRYMLKNLIHGRVTKAHISLRNLRQVPKESMTYDGNLLWDEGGGDGLEECSGVI